jgi:hypothetical protein
MLLACLLSFVEKKSEGLYKQTFFQYTHMGNLFLSLFLSLSLSLSHTDTQTQTHIHSLTGTNKKQTVVLQNTQIEAKHRSDNKESKITRTE